MNDLDKPKGREASKAYHHQKIIDATIDCIATYGFAGTTISRLTNATGLSRGMVNLHFSSKDQMLVEVLKHLADEYRNNWEEALKGAENTPAAKLTAIVNSDFDLNLFNAKKISVWLAYRVEAQSKPAYLRYCDNRERHFFETVHGLCEEVRIQGQYEVSSVSITLGLTSISEGLWFDFLLHPNDFDAVGAIENCLTFLRGAYPKHF